MARIRGATEVRAALRRAGPELRKEAGVEVKASIIRVHAHARQLLNSAGSIAPLHHGGPGMRSITGAARLAYRKSFTRDGLTGRVGLLNSTAGALELFFFLAGTSHQPARNVHDLAFEDERDVFIVNQTHALERVLRRMG